MVSGGFSVYTDSNEHHLPDYQIRTQFDEETFAFQVTWMFSCSTTFSRSSSTAAPATYYGPAIRFCQPLDRSHSHSSVDFDGLLFLRVKVNRLFRYILRKKDKQISFL